MNKKKCSSIGGQAVMEGVMMRGNSVVATAVRNSSGEILVESERFKPFKERSFWYRIPIIRGVFNFVTSIAMGFKIINRSAEVFGDMEEAKPSKFEKWLSSHFKKIDIMSIVTIVSAILGVLLAVGLFIYLPQLFTDLIVGAVKTGVHDIVKNLIAGLFRIVIFIGYIFLVSLMKDIKRVFRYHGAEHKVINCYEHGMELTVENAKSMTRINDRCGTTFMFIVMITSILFFSLFRWENNIWLRVGTRIIFIPIVAGISYEILKFMAKFDNKFVRILKAPGLVMQYLTTAEPDEKMLEVSLKAFNTVMAMEADKNLPTSTFTTFYPIEKGKKHLTDLGLNENEGEIILMSKLKVKTRSELYDGRRIGSDVLKECSAAAKERLKGAPLQYILGEAWFYNLEFKVDQRVLIPRFDTEYLVKAVIDLCKTSENPRILDLMTGSGAIGISLKKNVTCEVVSTDISESALEIARENAQKNKCEIDFRKGSLFAPVKEETFDIIVCNPPYIPSSDIPSLDKEVREYEPLIALDGGTDGLDFYRDITAKVGKHLKKGGYLVLEVGINQAEAVKGMLDGYETSSCFDDNNPPIERVIIAKRNEVEE